MLKQVQHDVIHYVPVIDFVQIAHARHSSSKLGSALTQSQFSRRFRSSFNVLFLSVMHRCKPISEVSGDAMHRCKPIPEASGGAMHRCKLISEASGDTMHQCKLIPEASGGAMHRCKLISEASGGAMHRCKQISKNKIHIPSVCRITAPPRLCAMRDTGARNNLGICPLYQAFTRLCLPRNRRVSCA